MRALVAARAVNRLGAFALPFTAAILVEDFGTSVTTAGLALALGSDRSGRLGVCAADPCDRVFTDTSRNGGRRFCSTRCQNRVKAAAHRHRSR